MYAAMLVVAGLFGPMAFRAFRDYFKDEESDLTTDPRESSASDPTSQRPRTDNSLTLSQEIREIAMQSEVTLS